MHGVSCASYYFLLTRRLGFRCWDESDMALARALWGDIKVSSLIGGPFSEEWIEQRLAKEIRMQKEHRVQYWPVFLLSGNAFVGCAGLRPYDLETQVFELGVHLLPEYWRQGFGEEASRAVVEHAFTVVGAQALFAGHHPDNVASRALLERLGFRFTHEELYEPTGRMHPSYRLSRPP